MMHMRRYFFKALDSDQERMGKALHLFARLYAVEHRAKGLSGQERLALRQRLSAPVMRKLHKYLLELRAEVLPKSPAAFLYLPPKRTVNEILKVRRPAFRIPKKGRRLSLLFLAFSPQTEAAVSEPSGSIHQPIPHLKSALCSELDERLRSRRPL